MKRFLFIAAALVLTTSACSSLADARPYYGGHYYEPRPNPYTQYFRQLRECQRHARLHRELEEAHIDEHDDGLGSRAEHRDLHEALDEAHDAYHDDRPRADYCDSVPDLNRPYAGRGRGSYRYGYIPYPDYGYGWSFEFGFRR